MFRLLLTGCLLFSFTTATPQKVLKTKAVAVKSNEEEVEIKGQVEDNILTLTIKKDGDTKTYQVDLNDEKALSALEDELENLELDVDMRSLTNDEDEDSYDIFINRMKGKGGYLGVQIQELTDQLRDYFKVKGDGGVLISEVVPDSPAEEAHLKAGDIIMRIDDTIISDPRELTQIIRSYEPETKVSITYIRRGREQNTSATLGEHTRLKWKGEMGPYGHKYLFDFDGDLPMPKVVAPDWQGREHTQTPKSLQKELEDLREEVEKLKEEVEALKRP